MKKKIAILGSTGSIGKNLINIINKDKKNFEIVLLTADENYKELLKQAKKYKVKNIIITNYKSYKILKSKLKKSKIKIFNNFNNLNEIFNTKVDYIMSAITGIHGLLPTVNSIQYTKKIAIANKESIICGWNIIQKKLSKYKTEFIPVDSEHFTIWYGIKNNKDVVQKLILTASGGPFINLPLKNFKNINLNQALTHPNWKMGKKITIDSSTMMNKVFEIIEAKKIFGIDYKNISIVTHPTSYIHSIIKFSNGLIKLIAHDTNMKIPIFNSLYSDDNNRKIHTKEIDIKKLNDLKFKKVDLKKFPVVDILKILPNGNSLFETVIVSANDALVDLFLSRKIKFKDLSTKLLNILKSKTYNKYKKIRPKNINEIIKLNNYVRLKVNSKSI